MKENIGKYGRIIESAVAGYKNKIGKIIGVWETKEGSGYILQFPTAVYSSNTDKLYPIEAFVEVIHKVYTEEDADKLKSDIEVLSLPKRIYCDSEHTLNIIANKLAQCHIKTSINRIELFIQT